MRLLRDARPGIHIIDDTYNANPASMRAAFSVLNDVTDRRAVAVLGTMFELGDRSAQLHREVGALAAASGATWLLALGDHGPDLVSGAADAGIDAQAFETIDELLVSLDDGLQSGDWVLVKGSRGMRMERVVAHLTGGKG